jgi:hypothetical protein
MNGAAAPTNPLTAGALHTEAPGRRGSLLVGIVMAAR